MRNQTYDYMKPVWTGDTALYESFWPVLAKDQAADSDTVIPLLYRADEILDVRTLSLETAFEKEKDYYAEGGRLIIPAGSAIKRFPWDEYVLKEEKPGKCFPCSLGGWVFFSEGPTVHDMQYAVTYRHSDRWLGPIPGPNQSRLTKFKAKLADKRPVQVAFTGDSITTGGNSTGVMNVPPYLPMWPTMVTDWIEDVHGCPALNLNRSRGGVCSDWGVETAEESFSEYRPDLCVIAYGMNDASGRRTSASVIENYKTITDKLLAINPDCEFIYVSTMLPNPIAPGFSSGLHAEHEPLMLDLAAETGGIADVAPVTSVHKYLLSRKRFFDMTGNNINHCNDFMARVYAQTICAVIG